MKERLKPYITQEPLCKLKTRARSLFLTPEGNGDEAWAGMHTLPMHKHQEHWQPEGSALRVAFFLSRRLNAVNDVLLRSPFVFLAGLTGTGKTTFVENLKSFEELPAAKRQKISETQHTPIIEPFIQLFYGENTTKEWAQNRQPGRKILFIDEANLGNRAWSEFEGLFNNPPGILHKGVWHTLTPEHKVIFAGNPLSYGDERTLPPLFERHGHSVVFEPLSKDVIYQQVLLPLLQHSSLETHQTEIAFRVLDVYSTLCRYPSSEILISPRELQMMVLMMLAYHKNHPETSVEKMAEHMIYQISSPLVPDAFLKEFNQQFMPSAPLPGPASDTFKGFLVTPSRMPIVQYLNHLTELQQWRRNHATTENQKQGGLGGLILEGAPGTGKSELIVKFLMAQGYKQANQFEKPLNLQKTFYAMPVSLDLDCKEKLLLKAFQEGAIVVIDEINSSAMMERLMNCLLTGKTPGGGHARKPGFMIIGTQNPPSMAGRRRASTALLRRLILVEVPDYTVEEMIDILCSKGLEHSKASEIAETWLENVQYARTHGLTPAPTLRDCLKLADKVMRGEDLMPEGGEKTKPVPGNLSIFHPCPKDEEPSPGHPDFSEAETKIPCGSNVVFQSTQSTNFLPK